MAGPVARVGAALAAAGALALAGAATAGEWDALDLYARVLGQAERSALTPPTTAELVYASLRGMARELDPYAQFFDPPAWARLEAEASGSYVGVGVTATPAACGAALTTVLTGGPGERAGLRVGECVTSVDGASLAGLGREDLVAALSGGEGAEATLTVVDAAGATRRVVVLRGRYADPGLTSERVGAVLVVRVHAFRDGTAGALARALAERPAALVLDLRGNPGGRLDQAVAVADLFLGGGAVVSTAGRGPGATRRYEASPSPSDFGGPVAVLVDGGTASAAEIVAGSLQQAHRAKLYGAPTWGKGTVQSLFRYEDGSALKLTDATWHLADGRSPTRAAPLQPDVALPSPREDAVQRLREHLRSLTAVSEAERARLLAELEALPLPPPAPAPEGDAVLARALAELGSR